MERESWSNVDRYWHHYAMPQLGDNADEICFLPSSCAELVVEYPAPDLCAYQITLDCKADILGDLDKHEIPRHHVSFPLPMDARRVVFADVEDDGFEVYQNPEHTFGERLAQFPDAHHYCPLPQEDAAAAWKADDFPQIRRLLQQPRQKLLYLEVFASASRTFVGEVEKKSAKCLEITESDVEEIADEEDNLWLRRRVKGQDGYFMPKMNILIVSRLHPQMVPMPR